MRTKLLKPGHERLVNAIRLVQSAGEDRGEWLAAHIGNLIDAKNRHETEIRKLNRKLKTLEKRLLK